MKKIKLGLAQMNPTVGDLAGNLKKILGFIEQAEKTKCDLIVFPELAISGYPVWDLANKKAFVRENLKALQQVVKASRRYPGAIVIGYIDEGTSGSPKTRNALAWVSQGRIRLRQFKSLLPTYDVFLEEIFFEPGKERPVLPWKGFRVGTAICEDLWDEVYDQKPLALLGRKGADLLVVINASPYHRDVLRRRGELLKRQSRRHGFPIIYVNQVGGQDDLIFDGRSQLMDSQGRVLFQAPAFEEGLFTFDWSPSEKAAPAIPAPLEETAEIYDALVLGVRDYVHKNKFKKVVIGLSGGIDSALTATLACDALGPERVLGVTMPGPYSSEGSWKDSEELAKNLGIEFRSVPIREKYESWLKCLPPGETAGTVGLAKENLQARLRGLELMFISNQEGRLVLTTGNKSELAMGYCTLYGDMAGGLCVLGDVYKTDVYRLARFRNQTGTVIPESVFTKPPSAELRPNQTDQDSLPPYEILDQILRLYVEKNKSRHEIQRLLRSEKVDPKMIQEVIYAVDHNEYKRRQAPPILRVTEKAWFGRRMPITNRFAG